MKASHYDRERRFWDKKGQEDYVSLSRHDQERLREWIGWRGRGRILDLGGGAGMMSRLLATFPETECVCLDISHVMLTHSPVPAVQGNALRLPFREGSFDLVIAAAFFHHLPGQEAALLREIVRVLAPCGSVAGYDPSALAVQNRIFMGNGPLRLALFSPDERPLRPDDLAGEVAAVGLEDFEYRLFSFQNARLTPFEAIQQYVLNPIAVGPLRPLLERWFFWRARRPDRLQGDNVA